MDETILGAIIGVGGAIIGAGITAGIQILFNKEAERKRILHFLIETKADVNASMIKLYNAHLHATNDNLLSFFKQREYYLKVQSKVLDNKPLPGEYEEMREYAKKYSETVNGMVDLKADLIRSLSKIYSYSDDSVKESVDKYLNQLGLIDVNCYEHTFDNMDFNRCVEYVTFESPNLVGRLERSVKQGCIDPIDAILSSVLTKYYYRGRVPTSGKGIIKTKV